MVLPVRTTACRPRLTASTTPQHSARTITSGNERRRRAGDEVPGTRSSAPLSPHCGAVGIGRYREGSNHTPRTDLEVRPSAGGAAHDALHVADGAAARLEVRPLQRVEQLELGEG
eukprot:scaffold11735_cov56-Phaeocystis_antarctica.AAC.3